MAAKHSDQAKAIRARANQAKRLAGTLAATADVDRLLRYAAELEAEAVNLDRLAKEED